METVPRLPQMASVRWYLTARDCIRHCARTQHPTRPRSLLTTRLIGKSKFKPTNPRLLLGKSCVVSQTHRSFRDKETFNFRGIRYAQPFQRWEHSAVANTTGNIDALNFGSQCTQAGNVGSEDCLFLNIWTPYLPNGNPKEECLKPVMFQIHGGAFTGGTGADPNIAGVGLASRGDVVVVTINYRLQTLGFLALDDGTTNGNHGLADQVTALHWVRKYIKAFGGDPTRVTIFGQSAGAGSVRALLGSPPAIGLYAAAIMQSNLAGLGYAGTYSQYYTIEQEVKIAATPILNATNCLNSTDQLSCLRSIDAHSLANLPALARFLVIDGKFLVRENLAVNGQGPAANVPVMTGFMRDDAASFISFPKAGVNNITAELGPGGFSPYLTPEILNLYPVPTSSNSSLDIYNASSALATDAEFRCLDEATAYSAVKNGVWTKAYVFTFNRTYGGYDPNPPVCQAPVDAEHPYGNPNAEYFKCHSGELQYVFGGLGYTGQPDRDGLDIPMSQMTVDHWAAFARTYDPNPDPAFLRARGFTNTSSAIESSGSSWESIDPSDIGNLTLRVFQWPTYQAPFDIFSSMDKCQAFGFGYDFYEGNPNGYSLPVPH